MQLIRLVKKSEAKRGLSSKLPHEIWAHAQQSFCDSLHDVHNARCACALTAGPTWWTNLLASTSYFRVTAALLQGELQVGGNDNDMAACLAAIATIWSGANDNKGCKGVQ